MATKLYLRTDTSSINPGSDDERQLSTSKGTAASTMVKNTVAGAVTPPTAATQFTVSAGGTNVIWYSEPFLNGQTISGAVTFNIWAHESATAANATITAELVRANNAGTVQSVIAAVVLSRTELTTTSAVQNWSNATVSSTAMSAGDRLAVRVYIDDGNGVTMASGRTVTITIAGPTDGADGDSYVQLTEDVRFPTGANAGINFHGRGAYVLGNIKLFLRNDPTMVAYYRLENNTLDESGSDNHLTAHNSPGYSRFLFSQGADFGTSNTNKRFTVSNDLNVDGGSMTLGCWGMTNADLASNTDGYFCILQDNTSKTEYAINIFNNAGTFQTIGVRTRVGQVDNEVRVNKKLEIGKPYFLCLTYDGTNVAFYINGQLQGQAAASGNGTGATTTEFDIGARNRSGTAGSFLNGKVDEVFVLKRAMSGTEIQNYYVWSLGPGLQNRYMIEHSDAAPAGQQPFFMMLGVGS